MDFNNKKEYGKFTALLTLVLTIATFILFYASNLDPIVPYLILGLAICSGLLSLVLSYPTLKEWSKKKGVRKGITSSFTILIFLGIFISLYLLAKNYLGRIDLTEEQSFSLSEETIHILKNQKSQIKIIVFNNKIKIASQIDPRIVDLIKSYAYESNQLEVQFLDNPLKHPDLYTKYKIPPSQEEFGPIVVEKVGPKPLQFVVIPWSEIVDYRLEGRGDQRSAVFRYNGLGESKITSALIKLESEKTINLYVTKGHDEEDFSEPQNPQQKDPNSFSELRKSLESENYSIKEIQLSLEKEIPSDCSVLILAGPAVPFSGEEVNKIKVYLDKGGTALILLDPQVQNLPLETFLSEWKIKLDNSFVVEEKYKANSNGTFFLPQYGKHPIVDKLRKPVLLYRSRPINIEPNLPNHLTVTPLLRSSKYSWIEKGGNPMAFDEGIDTLGPANVAVAIVAKKEDKTKALGQKEQQNEKNKSQKESRLIIVGNSVFLKNGAKFDTTGKMFYPNGRDFFLNSIAWLSNQERKIPPKIIQSHFLQLNQEKFNWIMIFTLSLPFSIIALGIWVYIRRKKKK